MGKGIKKYKLHYKIGHGDVIYSIGNIVNTIVITRLIIMNN